MNMMGKAKSWGNRIFKYLICEESKQLSCVPVQKTETQIQHPLIHSGMCWCLYVYR